MVFSKPKRILDSLPVHKMILRTVKEILVPLQTLRPLQITMVLILCLVYLFKT